MADWPDLEELKRRLDVTSDDFDETLDKDLASGIAQVKLDVGAWDEYEDEPDDKLSQAALRMAELIATRPEATPGVHSTDPTYARLLSGHRRRFSIA
jgi:hypothetical protein